MAPLGPYWYLRSGLNCRHKGGHGLNERNAVGGEEMCVKRAEAEERAAEGKGDGRREVEAAVFGGGGRTWRGLAV